MKAGINGVVNVSVLDGWWDEGWTGENGWAIGGRDTNPDEGAQDWADCAGPLPDPRAGGRARYYDRTASGVPAAWVDTCGARWRSVLWRFSTTRMLHEYVEQMYLPVGAAVAAADTDGAEAAAADDRSGSRSVEGASTPTPAQS